MTKLFSDAGHKWAGSDHGAWEPPVDLRAERIEAVTTGWMTDPGVISDIFADGIELPAIAAQLFADFETLDLPTKARLAFEVWSALYRHMAGAAEVAIDAGTAE